MGWTILNLCEDGMVWGIKLPRVIGTVDMQIFVNKQTYSCIGKVIWDSDVRFIRNSVGQEQKLKTVFTIWCCQIFWFSGSRVNFTMLEIMGFEVQHILKASS